MALKVVEAEPAGTVIVDTGTGNSALLLYSETAMPPASAALFRVTVHVVLTPEVKVVELHVSEESVTADARLMVAGCETLFRVAVSVAL